MPRLFVAIELPEEATKALETLQQRLKRLDTARAVRWSNSDGIHLTLKFLGDVPDKQVDEIKAHLQRAAQTVQPFALTLDGTGVFPDYRAPRIVWAGIQGQLPTLHALRDADFLLQTLVKRACDALRLLWLELEGRNDFCIHDVFGRGAFFLEEVGDLGHDAQTVSRAQYLDEVAEGAREAGSAHLEQQVDDAPASHPGVGDDPPHVGILHERAQVGEGL